VPLLSTLQTEVWFGKSLSFTWKRNIPKTSIPFYKLIYWEIPSSLGQLHHLKNLYLSNNMLKGRYLVLQNCSNLKTLWLDRNQLVGQIPTDLPHSFKRCNFQLTILVEPSLLFWPNHKAKPV
jgi:hypothetical protein